MGFKLAIFDFDGTLADSLPWVLSVVNDIADRFGFRRVAPDEVEDLRLLSARELMIKLGVSRWKVPLIARHLRARMARNLDKVPLFPGAKEVLQTLSEEGVRLAVVSSNGRETIEGVLGPETAGLIGSYCCGVSLFGKRSKLLKTAKLHDAAPSQVIAIGDELRDLYAAKAAGLTFGAVSWGSNRPEVLSAAGPDILFERMEQIVPAVLGGGRAGAWTDSSRIDAGGRNRHHISIG